MNSENDRVQKILSFKKKISQSENQLMKFQKDWEVEGDIATGDDGYKRMERLEYLMNVWEIELLKNRVNYLEFLLLNSEPQ